MVQTKCVGIMPVYLGGGGCKIRSKGSQIRVKIVFFSPPPWLRHCAKRLLCFSVDFISNRKRRQKLLALAVHTDLLLLLD